MYFYWTEEEVQALDSVSTFEEAAEIAIGILARMKKNNCTVVQICGPMSTGGLGDLKRNLALFEDAIEVATEKGLVVFDQIPFQKVIDRIDHVSKTGEYCDDILKLFYGPILKSGYIDKALFLPGWERSYGATRERKLVAELGIAIEEYSLEWLRECF